MQREGFGVVAAVDGEGADRASGGVVVGGAGGGVAAVERAVVAVVGPHLRVAGCAADGTAQLIELRAGGAFHEDLRVRRAVGYLRNAGGDVRTKGPGPAAIQTGKQCRGVQRAAIAAKGHIVGDIAGERATAEAGAAARSSTTSRAAAATTPANGKRARAAAGGRADGGA